jgi:hypothetical protein
MNAPLPQMVINFIIRKISGVILYLIQEQVKKIQSDSNCSHAKQIKANVGFYRDWLLPKLRYSCLLFILDFYSSS